jgi:hypothetical protein
MREWLLSPGDPLCLTIAADARLCAPDYANDHIWELEPGTGEPAALSLRTTFGMRARSVRLFPRFSEPGQALADPSAFAGPLHLRHFYPNFLHFDFSPFDGIEVNAEYWVPESQAVAGRLTLINHSTSERKLRLDWCALLVPLEGQNFKSTRIQSVNVLIGSTSELVPVLFLTGGPSPGPGPYPSLALDIELIPGATRQFTWAQAALGDIQASFELARHTAARPWDAEKARIEFVNRSQTVEIQTGDPEWDAALAFSQTAAFRLLMPGNQHLPHSSFVSAREPDNGYSRKGDGSDYTSAWSGQTPLESNYLASLLPGAPRIAQELLTNYLSVQSPEGFIDCRPGLGGQRGNFLAAPILANLAWNIYQKTEDNDFLSEVFSALSAFFWIWFAPEHDLNRDNLPEWDHLIQTDFEEHPLFSHWHEWSQGVDVSTVHSPALFAMLYNEAQCLSKMAERLGRRSNMSLFQAQAESLQKAVEEQWQPHSTIYRYTDRDTGLSQSGKILARQQGNGTIQLDETFEKPIRLLIQVKLGQGKSTRRPQITISEYVSDADDEKKLARQDFNWSVNGGSATSQKVYSSIGKIEVNGLDSQDKVIVHGVDLTKEDITLLLPLWAGIPDKQRAQSLIGRTLLDAKRFDHPFGLPACPSVPKASAEEVCLSVHFPWNQLIGEGLLRYGFRAETARLVAHMMTATIYNLKNYLAFYQAYHAENGTGIGVRNALQGLAPVGLFMKTLGVEIISAERVRLEGHNPFPWTVTVQYKGLKVKRHSDRTEVTFANGQTVTITNPAPCVVSQ